MTDPGFHLDDLEVSDASRQYLDSLPPSGGPAQVLANFARRSREEALSEKRERERLEAATQARLDFVEQAAFEGRPLRDQWAPLIDFDVSTAISDRLEDQRRQKEQDARAQRLEAQLADAKARLAEEKRQSATAAQRTSKLTSTAIGYRRQAEKAREDAAWAAGLALRPHQPRYWE